MSVIEEAVLTYIEAWNEHDPAMRQTLIERCWSDSTPFIGSKHIGVGYAALVDEIEHFQRVCPADRVVLTSGIDHNHGWFRFTAILLRPDGSTFSHAMDIGEVGSDGRICRLIRFPAQTSPIPE